MPIGITAASMIELSWRAMSSTIARERCLSSLMLCASECAYTWASQKTTTVTKTSSATCPSECV